nr:MAG TPA: hypothetical protein [Caudoviricetes sp.]
MRPKCCGSRKKTNKLKGENHMSPTITVPIRARYEIVEGQAILREAEYAEVDVKIIAEMLLKAFRVNAKEIDEK